MRTQAEAEAEAEARAGTLELAGSVELGLIVLREELEQRVAVAAEVAAVQAGMTAVQELRTVVMVVRWTFLDKDQTALEERLAQIQEAQTPLTVGRGH